MEHTAAPEQMTEAEERRRGEMIVEMLSLRPCERRKVSGSEEVAAFYRTTWGTKTALGLFRSIERIVKDGE